MKIWVTCSGIRTFSPKFLCSNISRKKFNGDFSLTRCTEIEECIFCIKNTEKQYFIVLFNEWHHILYPYPPHKLRGFTVAGPCLTEADRCVQAPLCPGTFVSKYLCVQGPLCPATTEFANAPLCPGPLCPGTPMSEDRCVQNACRTAVCKKLGGHLCPGSFVSRYLCSPRSLQMSYMCKNSFRTLRPLCPKCV